IFSSTKGICTLGGNKLSPLLLEALQVLTFIYKRSCILFLGVYPFLASCLDYAISGPLTARAVDELMATGEIDVLENLARNTEDT
ncbi:hypothetical protein BV22DRAFT_976907, partial [Leucogyrophana mollusca]